MRLYMVRHGETIWNAQKKLQGTSDIALGQAGIDLAILTGKGMADIPFTRVYTSPLKRACHTAQLIIDENNSNAHVEIVKEPRIREMAFGIYEGHCYSQAGWDMPDENFRNFFTNSGAYQKPEGGESFEEVILRAGNFIDEMAGESYMNNENILVASHGAMIKAMVNYVTGNSVDTYWGEGVHRNCGVTILEIKDGVANILEENTVYY